MNFFPNWNPNEHLFDPIPLLLFCARCKTQIIVPDHTLIVQRCKLCDWLNYGVRAFVCGRCGQGSERDGSLVDDHVVSPLRS